MYIYLLGRKIKLHDNYREVTQENAHSECDKKSMRYLKVD